MTARATVEFSVEKEAEIGLSPQVHGRFTITASAAEASWTFTATPDYWKFFSYVQSDAQKFAESAAAIFTASEEASSLPPLELQLALVEFQLRYEAFVAALYHLRRRVRHGPMPDGLPRLLCERWLCRRYGGSLL